MQQQMGNEAGDQRYRQPFVHDYTRQPPRLKGDESQQHACVEHHPEA